MFAYLIIFYNIFIWFTNWNLNIIRNIAAEDLFNNDTPTLAPIPTTAVDRVVVADFVKIVSLPDADVLSNTTDHTSLLEESPPVHLYPDSTPHIELHPSLFKMLPSSQYDV